MAHNLEREMHKIWLSEGRLRGMEHKSYSKYKHAKRNFRNIRRTAYDRFMKQTLDVINKTSECDIKLFGKRSNVNSTLKLKIGSRT